jgi:arylsulfatase A-like enzyme
MSQPAPHRRRLRTALAAVAAVAISFALCACGESSRPQRIVLISLDTLRADALADMPSLQARSARGRVFTRHYAATSCTQPTHATLFTGLHPWQHGVSRNGMVLDAKRTTLAERLHAAGWETSAVVASFPLAGKLGFAQGFARYRDTFDENALRTWEGMPVGDDAFYSLSPSVSDQALAALDEARGERQFFFFHWFDAHAPYGDDDGKDVWTLIRMLTEIRAGKPTGEVLGAARAAYGRDVAELDRGLERVLARLEADAQRFETHVIVFADHGESFGEAGVLGHGSRITDEQIHVPLLIFSPRVAPGSIDVPVGTIDITATVLALAGETELPVGARSLCAATLPPEVVLGMRRTFADPYKDVHVDGAVDVITGDNFYAVDGADVLTGDGERIREHDLRDREVTNERSEKLRKLFATLGVALQASTAEELSDPETQRALSELGYFK